MPQQIKWLEWSKEAFEKAKREKRPIILDIYGVWCHWCHRIDEDCYENPEIIKIINEKFIPIKVDTDKRPDINERYNQGGWPSTVFLDDEGRVLAGGTYIPPDRMKELLLQISEDYSKGRIKSRTSDFEQREQYFKRLLPTGTEIINHSVVLTILDHAVTSFDFDYGGFGSGQKFPSSDVLKLAMLESYKAKDKRLLKIATITLDNMIDGIFDKAEGGFFRYSVTRDWKTPHYEKMLETNAGILDNLLDAWQLTQDDRYKEIILQTIAYINSNFSDQYGGGLYGSQDADEEYYKIKDIQERKKQISPKIDKNIYTDICCMMISSCLKASIVLKNDKLKDFALKSLNFLLNNLFDKKSNKFYHYWDSGKNTKSETSGLLSDQAYTVRTLLDVLEITQDKKYLEHAEKVTAFCFNNLAAPDGSFFDKPEEMDAIGLMKVRNSPLIENSVMADSLIRLHSLTDKVIYKQVAERIFAAFGTRFELMGFTAAPYGFAMERYLNPITITIIGKPSDEKVQDLLNASLEQFEPRKIVHLLDPIKDKKILEEKDYPIDKPLAMICKGQVCVAAVAEPGKIREGLEKAKS